MKTHTALLLVGGAIIIGVAAYFIVAKKKPSSTTNETGAPDELALIPDSPSDNVVTERASFSLLDETKEAVASSIITRHSEASKIIDDSLASILTDKDPMERIETEHSDRIKKMTDEIDDILK